MQGVSRSKALRAKRACCNLPHRSFPSASHNTTSPPTSHPCSLLFCTQKQVGHTTHALWSPSWALQVCLILHMATPRGVSARSWAEPVQWKFTHLAFHMWSQNEDQAAGGCSGEGACLTLHQGPAPSCLITRFAWKTGAFLGNTPSLQEALTLALQ